MSKTKRMNILDQLSDLEDEHCYKCPFYDSKDNRFCLSNCEIGKEMSVLGDKLLSIDDEKIEEYLAKGLDMTTKEIVFLIDKGVTRQRIAKTFEIDRSEAGRIISEVLDNDLGNSRNILSSVEAYNLKSEGYRLVSRLKERGFNREETMEMTGYKKGTIDSFRSLHNKYERIKRIQGKGVI